MRRFTLRVRHDNGIISIHAVARSEQSARALVCLAERCPDRAIRRVYAGKFL